MYGMQGVLPTMVASGMSVDVILDEKINFTSSVLINSKTLAEIPIYTRTIQVGANYPLCEIAISIPFTANDQAGKRSRIVLFLDTEPIYDGTVYGPSSYNLVPVNIAAKK